MSSAPSSNRAANKELLSACALGDAESASAALSLGADPDCRSQSGHTALMIACATGKKHVAKLLLAAGAGADLVGGPEQCTALILAAAVGSVQCVNLMLKSADPRIFDTGGIDPLKAAVWNGHADCAKILASRCDPLARDDQGSDALCIAALRGDDACVSLLIHACDPTSSGSDGVTALMCACAHGDLDCISALLPVSVIDARDAMGENAVDIARKNGNPDAALFILTHLDAVAKIASIRDGIKKPERKSAARARKPRG